MSIADATLRMVLLGDDVSASAALKRVGDSASATQKRFALMSSNMTKFGKTMSHAFTLPALAIAAGSAKIATDFSSAMTRIQTQAGGSAHDVQVLSKQVLALSGSKLQQGPVDLANSLYHLKSVGMDNADAMKALVQASHLAAVGNASLEDTTNALAGAWRTGIKGARNFNGAVASLNAIVGAGNMTMTDLNAALGTGFLISARTAGISLKDAGSALALLTDEGQHADAAATHLRMTFALMAAPSKAAAAVLQTIGLRATSLGRAMRSGGLVSAIGLLKQHLEGLSKVQQEQVLVGAFGGGRSSAAIMSLVQNLDVLRKKEAQVAKGMSKFGADVAAQAKTPQAQFHQLIATLETLGVEIGNKLLPILIRSAEALNSFAQWFTALSPNVQKAAAAFGILLAVMGPGALITARLINAYLLINKAIVAMRDSTILLRIQLAALWVQERLVAIGTKVMTAAQWLLNAAMDANPVGLVIVALAALAVGLVIAYKKSATFRAVVQTAFHAVGVAAAAVFNWIKDHWPLLLATLGGPVGLAVVLIIKNFRLVEDAIRVVGDWARWLWNNAFQPALKFIVQGLSVLLNMWGHMLTALGHVPGFGWATGAGKALESAANKALRLANSINKIPSQKTVTVDMVTNVIHNVIHTTGGHVPAPTSRGSVGRVTTGAGRSAGLTYGTHYASTSAYSSAAQDSLGTITVVVKNESGQEIERSLVKLRRQRGGAPLRFE